MTVVRVVATDPKSYENAVIQHPEAILLYGELLSNPKVDVLDIESLVRASKLGTKPIITIVDNTFATAFNCRLLKDHGVDIVINSCTKYYGGHSDLLAGMCSNDTAGYG